MKTTFVCGEVLSAIQAVIGAISNKSKLPILNHLLIVSDGLQWKITGSDLELSLIATVNLTTEPFSVCLPAKKLYEVLRSFAKTAIVGLSLHDGKATLQCGRSRFLFNTLPAEDYPSIPSTRNIPLVELDQTDIAKLIHSTAYAVAINDVRYYLTGLLFEFEQFKFHVVGTDGHRMAVRNMELSIPVLRKEMIIPINNITVLGKLLSRGVCKVYGVVSSYAKEEDVCSISGLVLELGSLTVITNLIDGRFPDWRRVMPTGKEGHQVVLDRCLFMESVRRVSLALDGRDSVILLEFSKNQLRISARSVRGEESDDVLEIDLAMADDEQQVISLNADYLLETLSVISDPQVAMWFLDNITSVRFAGTDKDNSVHVIMTCRI